MGRAARAGIRYGLLVFAVGFLLGTLRYLVVAPRLGQTAAVIIELPLILAASWWISRRLVAVHDVPDELGARSGMGAIALSLLLFLETSVGWMAFDVSPGQQLMNLRETPAALGLAGQLLFATFPALQSWMRHGRGGRGRD